MTQFSLRTLLIGTTLAAVAFWWFLQPESGKKEFAGGKLKLWRQVRTVGVDAKSISSPGGGVGGVPGPNAVITADDLTLFTLDGAWRLSDENGDLLVRGRFADDVAVGKWTIWHSNGRKAAEGSVQNGMRSGMWRTWHENGRLASEVTYRAVLIPAHRTSWTRQHWWQSTPPPTPVVSSLGPIGPGAPLFQFGGGGMDAGPGNGPFFESVRPRSWTEPEWRSERHGRVKVWFPSGALRYEGAYKEDQRDGQWRYYDEAGQLTESGHYVNDLREGEWLIAGDRKVHFLRSKAAADHERLVASIRLGLKSANRRRQMAAVDQAESLGPAGVELLVPALDAEDDELKLLVLCRLMRMKAVVPTAVPQLDRLTRHANQRLAVTAMVVLYQTSPAHRNALYQPLQEKLLEVDSMEDRIEALVLLYDCDFERRELFLLSIVHLLAKEEPCEFGPILRAGPEAAGVLAQAYDSKDSDVRLYVLGALEQIVERVPPQSGPDKEGKLYWPLPESIQIVVRRAKEEVDPEIRYQAGEIGVFNPNPPPVRGGGMGGGGGFF